MSGSRDRRYTILMRLAAVAVVWEQLWPRLWPLVAVCGLFAAVVLLDLLPALPVWLHVTVLVGFAVAAALALRRAMGAPVAVSWQQARSRLERDSGLAHRPLTALEDDLVAGADDPAARALWQAHLQRQAASARALRIRAPSPGMARLDPWGLRVLVVLALIVAVSAGSDHVGTRLLRAVMPQLAAATAAPASVDVWLTPPAYTGAAPLFLHASGSEAGAAEAAGGEAIRVPWGSTLLSQVSGPGEAPRLVIGDRSVDFSLIAAGEGGASGYRVETVVEAGDRLEVQAGRRVLAAWPLQVVADAAPEVQFTEPPTATNDAFLRVGFKASDDYGVKAVTAVVEPPEGLAGDSGDKEIRLTMPLTDPGAASLSGQGDHDLTPHPWAGLETTIHLEAEDGAGQMGSSDSMVVRLPERVFTHPVARAVVAERKRLVSNEDQDTRNSVADALGAIASRPKSFADDMVVSLALAVAQGRLRHDRSPTAVASARSILWDTALRLEQGTVPIADRRLREARQRLLDALSSDADSDEIERLMDELQRALDEYLSALAAELARQGAEGAPPPMGQMLRGQDLQQLVDLARQMARSGSRDGAHKLLSELQRILDGIRAGLADGRGAEDLMEAQRLLNSLRELAGKQQDLLDQTYEGLRQLRAERLRGQGSQPSRSPGHSAAEQEALRRQLGDLMLQLDELVGSIPEPLGQAERAMQEAAEALGGGRPADAVPPQTKAVEHLRGAAEAAAAAMAEQLGGFGAMFAPQPGGFKQGGDDPFGRFGPDGFRGFGIGEVEIPQRMQMREVEEILQELRRRAGEQERPQPEREYIKRLLRRF